jgi:hypothetical protein
VTTTKPTGIERAVDALIAAHKVYLASGAPPNARLGFRQHKGFTRQDAERQVRDIVERFQESEEGHQNEKIKSSLRALLEAIDGLPDEAIQRIEWIRLRGPAATGHHLGPIPLAVPLLRGATDRALKERWDKVRKTGTHGPPQWGLKENPTAMEVMCSSLWLLHYDWAGVPTPPRSHPGGGGLVHEAEYGPWETMLLGCLEAIGLPGAMEGDIRRNILRAVHRELARPAGERVVKRKPGRKAKPRQ